MKRAANLNPGFDLEGFRQNQLDLHNHYRQLHGVAVMTRDNTYVKLKINLCQSISSTQTCIKCLLKAACFPLRRFS